MVGPQHPEHPSSINRFDAFGDYDYVDTSPPLNAPSFESLRCEKIHEICPRLREIAPEESRNPGQAFCRQFVNEYGNHLQQNLNIQR